MVNVGKNASPIDGMGLVTGNIIHYLQGFIHPRWLFGISSINSMVVPILEPPEVLHNSIASFVSLFRSVNLAVPSW